MGENDGADELQVQRVRTGGARRATTAVLAIASTLAVLIWHPWGPTGLPGSSPVASPVLGTALGPGPSTGVPAPSVAAVPTSSPSTVVRAGTIGPYRSLVDNEWTVVALLTPGTTATEEPTTPHAPLPIWSADGPFVVLQQGLGQASKRRVSEIGGSTGLCSSVAPPLARPAVHLPAGRVAYLGITYPGMDPKAAISATVLGHSGGTLRRVSPVVVQLDGLSPAGRYSLPSSGPGATVLFAASRPGIIPIDAYRFEVSTPGVAGLRYLYACIGT